MAGSKFSSDVIAAGVFSVIGLLLPLVALLWGSYVHIVGGISLAGMALPVTIVLAIVVLWLGFRALRRIRKSDGALRGKRLAIAAMAICLCGPFLSVKVISHIVEAHQALTTAPGFDALRLYASAQARYESEQGTFAESFAQLAEKGLIDHHLARAEKTEEDFTPKHNYYYVSLKTSGGVPLDRTTGYAVCAIPTKFEWQCSFVVTEAGVIYHKHTDGEPITDLPTDLEAEGWKPME